jgi:signal transduction histidine kinase
MQAALVGGNPGEQVCLDLIDTGQGMAPEVVAKVFQPFYSTKQGGTGLGLPTARRIIEAHSGTITAQSEVGRGTKFTLTLRAVPPTPTRPQELTYAGPNP